MSFRCPSISSQGQKYMHAKFSIRRFRSFARYAGICIALTAASSALAAALPTIIGTPNDSVDAGQIYSFTPVATAPDGESLSFTIFNQPAWTSFNALTGQLRGTPASANQGTYAGILISAKSSSGKASLAPFYIVVQATNSPGLLKSIGFATRSLQMRAGFTQQLAVVGTFGNGSTSTLPPNLLSFRSSNPSVASVNAATGVLTIAANSAAGATATISASETAAKMSTSLAESVTVVVISPDRGPTSGSVVAAEATVKNNPLCGSPIAPYYWEIGDQQGPAIGGSVGANSSQSAVLATTALSVASASKLIYGAYVTQLRGAASNLTAADINFLHFTSGYTNMASGNACPNTLSSDTVNGCLTLSGPQAALYSAQDPATVGTFNYNSGHMENHASQLTNLGNVPVASLGAAIQSLLGGTALNLVYSQPLMAGGIYVSEQDYAQVLRNILSGSLAMRDALGIDPVCTLHSATCNATYSPIPESWHYSIGHWVEDDPATNGDGAFSSPGMYGFYPWIDASKTYYGIISRDVPTATGMQQGYASAQCGRLIRNAWITGVEQTGTLPAP
jgi:Putative Ig domain